MDQELFQNVKTFLEKEKGCSNVESEVPIKEKSQDQFEGLKVVRGIRTAPKDFGHIDIVGGKFYRKMPEDPRYIGIQLHCIEYKSPNDDIIKGIGQIFWYKFAMSKLYIWVEQLFLYLMIHEDNFSEDLKEFCECFGIGLLQANAAKIITEVVTPENQHGLLARLVQDNAKVKCPPCQKTFAPQELNCPNCGKALETSFIGYVWEFADTFGSSSTNPRYKGVPHAMPEEVEITPMLKKVFGNWSKVKATWET